MFIKEIKLRGVLVQFRRSIERLEDRQKNMYEKLNESPPGDRGLWLPRTGVKGDAKKRFFSINKIILTSFLRIVSCYV